MDKNVAAADGLYLRSGWQWALRTGREWVLREQVLRQTSHQKQNASSNTSQLKIIFVYSNSNFPPLSPSLYGYFYDFLKNY